MMRRLTLAALGAVCAIRFVLFLVTAIAPTAHVYAQQVQQLPDCTLNVTFKATGRSNPLANAGLACQFWSLTYKSNGFSGVTLELDAAPDSSNAPGTWAQFSGTSQLTNTSQGSLTATGFQPWLSVQLVSATGSGAVNVVLQGWRNSASSNPTATIKGLPAIVYNANGINTLTNGQTSSDVQITNNGGVLVSGMATTDGVAVLSTATTSTLGSSVWAVDANPNNLYGFNIGQASSAVCYLQTYNTAAGSVTVGTTPSVATFVIPGLTTGAGNSIPPGLIPLKNYSTALTMALTTTPTGSTTCGPGVGTVFFK